MGDITNVETFEVGRLGGIDFKVRDLSLAAWGRQEIRLAEHDMPGLMALRRQYG